MSAEQGWIFGPPAHTVEQKHHSYAAYRLEQIHSEREATAEKFRV